VFVAFRHNPKFMANELAENPHAIQACEPNEDRYLQVRGPSFHQLRVVDKDHAEQCEVVEVAEGIPSGGAR
jgi:hypothetical protein